MPLDLNPQAAQVADESMVRNLAAQATAIWPQELPLLRRYALPGAARILDAGCGTGEASVRLAQAFPQGSVLGVDIVEEHLERGRVKAVGLSARVHFENRSIFELGLPPHSFDLTVCRHVLQSIPLAEKAIAELVRVTRRGGTVHLIAEDYGMIHFPVRRFDPRVIWPEVPMRYGAATQTDLLIGRRAPALLAALGLTGITVDYIAVDTLRVPREVFAAIWEAWRDGYAPMVAELMEIPLAEARERWDDQIASIRDPASYAVWMVPVVAGVVPGQGTISTGVPSGQHTQSSSMSSLLSAMQPQVQSSPVPPPWMPTAPPMPLPQSAIPAEFACAMRVATAWVMVPAFTPATASTALG
jgi:ubiquinone/menaquinone biosynthesis C-methylase UbiE